VASFKYSAVSPTGVKQTGVITAPTRAAASNDLKRQALTPIAIDEADPRAETKLRPQRGIKQRDLATAYQQVADLIDAGVPLLRALTLVGNRKDAPALAAAFRTLAERVEDGDELAEAMQQQPNRFPYVHNAMVRAGEKGGFLEQSLSRLSALVLRQVELREKIIGAAAYPAVIGSIGVLLMLALFLFFVPIFQDQFVGEVPIPPISQLLFFTSSLLTDNWPIGLALGIAAAVGGTYPLRKP